MDKVEEIKKIQDWVRNQLEVNTAEYKEQMDRKRREAIDKLMSNVICVI